MSVRLSASRIKTLNSCSWLYYCNYILKLPEEGNDGAKRGTIVHNVLEFLLVKENKEIYDLILENKTMYCHPTIEKMVLEQAKELEVDDSDNLELMDRFAMCALQYDFYCFGADEVEPEKEFFIENENPKYTITGFIDKIAKYIIEKKVSIIDYKTSKTKFSGEEARFNIQALLYCLAARHLWPEFKDRELKFLFLKFPRKPELECEFTDEQLDGFELYLEYLNEYLSDFDYEKGCSNFAADSKKSQWLCGKFRGDLNKEGKPAFICKFKYPMEYFAVVDKDGKVKRGYFTEEEAKDKAGEEDNVVKKKYGGCPRFRGKL